MKFLGYDVDELIEAAKEADFYLFECGGGCGCFDNAVFKQDDVPQCPRCLSADVMFSDGDVEHVMMLWEAGLSEAKPSIYSNAMCEAKAEREAEL